MAVVAQRVLLVDGDLLSAARLEGAARSAGAELVTCRSDQLQHALEDTTFGLIVLDLDGGGTDALDRVTDLANHGRITGKVVAFVSHVDERLRDAAADAGVEAIPRGRFWRSLGQTLSEA